MISQLWKDLKEYKKLNENQSKSNAWILLHRDYAQIIAIHRLREKSIHLNLSLANHILRRIQTLVYGIEIGKNTHIGTGTRFIHPIGITIGGNSHIGERVTFLGSNTVGTSTDNGYPFIDSDTTIGAGAKIIGPIKIGKQSVVGANSLVNRDIPANSTAVGIPAKILTHNEKTCKHHNCDE